jgi:hypothetical protein
MGLAPTINPLSLSVTATRMDQRGQTSLISMAHVASPSMVLNHAEFDDDYAYRCTSYENRGTERGGQKKSDEYLVIARDKMHQRGLTPLSRIGKQSFTVLPERAKQTGSSHVSPIQGSRSR